MVVARTVGRIPGASGGEAFFSRRHWDDPLRAATALAGRIATQAPLAVRAATRALRLAQDQDGGGLEAALRREADVQASVYGSEDLKEGVMALKDRRRPAFSGE